MALTASNPFPIGTIAPQFMLLDTVSDQKKTLKELKGKHGTLILFICNHCPFVLHINTKIIELANKYMSKGIAFVAISSNDIINYPDDSPERMKIVAENLAYPFPYLYDESQEVAKAYNAACTPDFYLFDDTLKSVYHGQLDASRPGNKIPVTGNSLVKAMEAMLKGDSIVEEQLPSVGCGIKWK